ncbi:DegV family protein [Aedoeadaptatus pacaensis]|uniref:DegV family protein n=1 Tax=Aedoeadaptatus pacaensis TaxID=1776390 RepID=UPI000838E173|nr:DegV family protein [Peptoniphilus pacaensis]
MIKIFTDDGSDLNFKMREGAQIVELPIAVTDGENEFETGKAIDIDTFYDNMRQGTVYRTSRVLPGVLEDAFREALEEGHEVLYISLSSGLSSSYEGAEMVKAMLEKDYPGKIAVVDSKAATFGEGLLALKAAILRDRGESLEAIADYLNKIKTTSHECFTVGTLEYLHRGGRVSKATKIAGGVLQLCPLLELEKENGTLEVLDVYRGHKAYLKKLRKYMEEHSKGGVFNPNQRVYVYSGDWPERVAQVKEFLIKDMGMEEKNIDTSPRVGCVIGAHTGPDICVVTFSGDPDELSLMNK